MLTVSSSLNSPVLPRRSVAVVACTSRWPPWPHLCLRVRAPAVPCDVSAAAPALPCYSAACCRYSRPPRDRIHLRPTTPDLALPRSGSRSSHPRQELCSPRMLLCACCSPSARWPPRTSPSPCPCPRHTTRAAPREHLRRAARRALTAIRCCLLHRGVLLLSLVVVAAACYCCVAACPRCSLLPAVYYCCVVVAHRC